MSVAVRGSPLSGWSAPLKRLLAVAFAAAAFAPAPSRVAAVPGRPPHWVDLAVGANGTVVLGAAYEDGVFLSTDGAKTFRRAPLPYSCKLCRGSRPGLDDYCKFSAVAASADGKLLFTAASLDGVYRSTDGGASWSKTNAPSLFWQQSMACSASGQHVFALTPACLTGKDRTGNACSTYGIWRSENAGATFVRSSGAQALNWRAIAVAANGQRLVAAVFQGGIYKSADYGKSFTKTGAPNTNYMSVAVSADANRVVALAYGQQNIMISSDFGGKWTARPVYVSNSPPWQPWVAGRVHSWHNWQGLASSANGERLVTVSNYGFLHTSSNTGTNFWPNTAATPAKVNATTGQPMPHTAAWEHWSALAMSADGKTVVAAEVTNNALFLSTNYGTGVWTQVPVPAVTC